MPAPNWQIGIVKAMFPQSSWPHIEDYFGLIETALDAKLDVLYPLHSAPISAPLAAPLAAPSAVASAAQAAADHVQLERLRLKLYAYATIRAENVSFSCRSEDISKLNTPFVTRKLDLWARPPLDIGTVVPAVHFGVPEIATNTSLFDYKQQLDTTKAFSKYDFRANLGNHAAGMGALYRGRGFFQLTGFYNYDHFGKLAGIPGLALHPEQAGKPAVAATLLAEYMFAAGGKGHDGYAKRILKALAARDFRSAREVVNGRNKDGKPPNGLKPFTAAYLAGADAASVPSKALAR